MVDPDLPPEGEEKPPQESTPSEEAAGELTAFKNESAEKPSERLLADPVEPQQLAKIVAEAVTVEIKSSSHAGPLPSPDMLAEYEKVVPGLAVRIVDRADKEQAFRHDILTEKASQERAEMTYAGRSRYLGQVFGFVLAMTAIGGGIYLLQQGHDVAGLTTIITAVVGLVAVFIGSKAADLWIERNRSLENDSE